MPELPEVESIRLGLTVLIGKTIKNLRVYKSESLLDKNSLDLSLLRGQQVKDIVRRGKYLRFELSDYSFLLHLGMSGVLRVDGELEKHTHLVLEFAEGGNLTYTDPRRFGYWCLLEAGTASARWDNLGPDALTAEFNAEYLYDRSRRSSIDVKSWILNQQMVAGVGNIYASEALFAARIHPERPANSLSATESGALVAALQSIMSESIKHRGTTFSDYKLSNGKSGEFQNFLQVFQKEDLPCPTCGTEIVKINQKGRSTFFCPHCQTGAV